jgi:ribonuclease HII
VKEEAAKSSISPDDVDKLALNVAVMDNVLTQAAVNLIAYHTYGELKEILSALNIYEAGLKTWIDMQQHVCEKSNLKIQPEDMNKIAADILSGIDLSIARLREKILACSDNIPSGSLIKQSVNTTDLKSIKNADLWMQSVYNESIIAKVKDYEMVDLIAKLSAFPNTDGSKYLDELRGYSDEKLKEYFESPSFKKAVKKT